MPTEQTFSTQEAADKLGVSVRTIRNMIERGSLNAHKVDPTTKSVYRIPMAEVQRLLGERKNQRDQQGRER
jgi:excisionase family DNA binding protein